MEELIVRQEHEVKELEESCKQMLKAAKKSEKVIVQTRIIQLEFDLKAKHRDEIDELEETLGDSANVDVITVSSNVNNKEALLAAEREREQQQIQAKKAKNQRKKEKKVEKETTRSIQLQEIKATAGPSLRETELDSLNSTLTQLGLKIKEIISDGNCLYRAIADQLQRLLSTYPHLTTYWDTLDSTFKTSNGTSNTSKEPVYDYIILRKIASKHIHDHFDDFAPFLGFETINDPNFDLYCMKINDISGKEWGGQLEIRAISESLHIPIYIYEANTPVIKMGDEYLPLSYISSLDSSQDVANILQPVVHLTYHRHYYALGEHYNSVELLKVLGDDEPS